PLMIVCATRPDRETPAWAAKELAARTYPHRFHEIPLRPLTAADTNALVNQLLTISDLPEKLRTRILEKTDGNPFFIEEVVRTLIENGMVVRETNESGTQWRAVKHVEDIEIPGNLQALLVARIDRLEEGARRTLQLASVIGRSFYFRVLDAINRTVSAMENELDYQLLTLQQAELIREAARTPELEYMFKHVLTQEAAYSTILLRQRRKFHQQAGEAIERLFPERLDEFASLLAHHFGEAHDPRAARYEMLAGDAAYRVYAIPEAISHYEKVLRFFKQASGVLDKNLGHVFIRLGRCLELQSRYAEALDLYAEMTALARERGDEALELEALIVQGKVYAVPNHYQNPEKAQNFSDRALFLAQKLGDLRAEARIEWNFQLLKMYTGKMDAGIPHGERAIVLAQKLGMRDIEAHALQDLGLAYMAVGELAKTQNVLERARPIWQALGNLPMVVENFANASYERIMAGDFEEALRLSQRSFDLAKEIQNQWGQVNSRVFTSQAFLALGKIDQVNEIQNYFIPLARGFGHPGSALVLVQKAWTYANLGNFALAKEAADEAIQDSKTFAPFHAYALAVRAWYEIQDGNLPTAEQLLAQSVEIIGYNKTLIEIDILLTYIQTEMQLAQGQIADALEKVSALVTYLKQARILYFLPETLALKARLELRLDQAAVADQSLTQAYQIACTINFRTQAWKLAATLAQRAEQTGQLAQAEGFRQEAKIMVAFICENIQDQDVLARFKVFVEKNGVSLPQHQN
ncbi:MAG: hypothetical protein HUU38_20515, partial [Anaerolineales bacterium]|nr:hypothetical protein [Anaerolineales bacterium]